MNVVVLGGGCFPSLGKPLAETAEIVHLNYTLKISAYGKKTESGQ